MSNSNSSYSYLKDTGLWTCGTPVENIVENMGWKNHFNGALLGAPFESVQTRKSKAQLMREAISSSGGTVFVAGDSAGDIKAARELANSGIVVRSLGITTGVHRAEELLDVGADTVFDSLAKATPYLDSLAPQGLSLK